MGNDSSSRYSRLIAHIGSSNGCMVEKFYLGKNGMKWAKNEHDMSYIRSYVVVRVGPQRVTTREMLWTPASRTIGIFHDCVFTSVEGLYNLMTFALFPSVV